MVSADTPAVKTFCLCGTTTWKKVVLKTEEVKLTEKEMRDYTRKV